MQPRILTVTLLISALMILGSGCAWINGSFRPAVSSDIDDDVNVAQVSTGEAIGNTETTNETLIASSTESLQCLDLRAQSAQLIAVLVTAKELQELDQLVTDGQLGFISLVGKHDYRIKGTLSKLQSKSNIPLLVASDEESSSVQRLAAAIRPLPSVAKLLSMSLESVRELYRDYGEAMVALGVTINFAPVIDIGFGPGIGTRSFGDNPDGVIDYAGAIADGLREAGVLPVFKHFPGHGSASGDSHEVLPTTRDFTLMGPDLAPYRALLSDPAGVMVGHLMVPGLTERSPTSLSPRAIDKLLRTHLGFDGIVFTDALNMGAITDTYTTESAAIAAINAGADVVMVAGHSSVGSLLDAILEAVESGKLNRQQITDSAAKILRHKGYSCRSPLIDNEPSQIPFQN